MNATAVMQRGKTREQVAEEAMAVMQRARVHVAIYHCFYGALLARVKLRVDWRHPTMYTDAVVIGFNPEFVLSKRFEEIIYILVHEVMHCALGHPFRRNNRDPKPWNEACDHVVNLTLNRDDDLRAMFPKEGLADPQYIGMATETVYSLIVAKRSQQPEPQPQPDGLAGASGMAGDCCDAGASGEPVPSEDGDEADNNEATGAAHEQEKDADAHEREDDGAGEPTDAEDGDAKDGDADERDVEPAVLIDGTLDDATRAALERGWSEAVMTAQLAAGGDIDAALARAIGQSQQQRKSFLQHVEEFATATCDAGETWARPNRRYADAYLPSRGSPGVRIMVLGVDTSGSIGDDALATMEKAAQWVMDDFGLKAMHVVYCDSHVRGVDVFNAGEQVTLENAKGGGGTRFHPVLRYALEQQQQGEEVAGVIYLTDMEGYVSDPEDFRDLAVLWVNIEPRNNASNEAPEGIGSKCNIDD